MYAITVQTEDFSLEHEINAIYAQHPDIEQQAGAVISFVGRVRGHDSTTPLSHLYLEHMPGLTEAEITKIVEQAHQRWPLRYTRVIHRVGQLEVGEQIVLVLTFSEHRQAAYDGNAYVMDYLKTRAPFWKKAFYRDGQAQWVAQKASDLARQAAWEDGASSGTTATATKKPQQPLPPKQIKPSC